MYLLGTQELTNLFSLDPARSIHGWLQNVRPGEHELFVSAISLGMIANQIERLELAERNQWRRRYAEGRRKFEDRGSIVHVDIGVVDVWASNLRGRDLVDDDETTGERTPLGEDSRLVIATAITRGYSLVTKMTPVLQDIANFTTLTIVEP